MRTRCAGNFARIRFLCLSQHLKLDDLWSIGKCLCGIRCLLGGKFESSLLRLFEFVCFWLQNWSSDEGTN